MDNVTWVGGLSPTGVYAIDCDCEGTKFRKDTIPRWRSLFWGSFNEVMNDLLTERASDAEVRAKFHYRIRPKMREE